MTKAEIVEKIYEIMGISKREAAEIVDTVFEIMKETLEKGEKIKISRFGNFVVRSKRERIGRNPHTREAITITPRKVVTFKASQLLKKAVNKGAAAQEASSSPGETQTPPEPSSQEP